MMYVVSFFIICLVMLILLNMGSGQSLVTNISLNLNHSGKKRDAGNKPVENIFNKTQPEVTAEERNNQSTESPVNSIFLSGLGASLGGAIAGGFFGSFLQTYFSNKSVREKDHLNDLKEHVADPLVCAISNTNFTLSDFKFDGFRFEVGGELGSDDILFQDFLENHYSDVHTQLKSVLKLGLDVSNKEHKLFNKLKSDILNVFSNITTAANGQSKNENVVDTITSAILENRYDDSYLRIAEYTQNRYLYFYPVEYSKIAFSEAEKYVVFSSAGSDQEFNINEINRIRSVLIQGLNGVVSQMREELQDYIESDNEFSNERKKLLQRLLELKYRTRLDFERRNLIKRCPLV